MQRAFTKILLLSVTLLTAIMMQSCLREEAEPPKGMADLYSEEGIPVTTAVVNSRNFQKSLEFNSTLKGIKESVEIAKVEDKIVKINVNVGSYVNHGDVVMEFPENNPLIQYSQAKAGYDIAKKTYKRMEELLKAGEISQQQFDQTETEFLVQQRNFEQVNQLLNVQSPISGTIISLPFREGDVPKAGDVLFTVSQMNKMIAYIQVTDKEIHFIKEGMPANIHWNGNTYTGRVRDISLAMDKRTKAFPVEIEINNSKKELKSGMLVSVSILTSNKEDAIVIPKHLVKQEGDNSFIFVLKDSTAEKRIVEVGQTSGNGVEITSGLQIGDKLINCCMNMLENGLKVNVTKEGEM